MPAADLEALGDGASPRMNIRFSLLLAFLLLMACAKEPTMKDAVPPTPGQLQEFTQNTGIKFPASSVQKLYWEERGMDDALYLKVSLPIDDLSTFISAPPFSGVKISSYNALSETKGGDARIKALESQMMFDRFRAWIPHQPKTIRYCEPELPNARFMNCLFDCDNPKEVTMYLMWFET